MRDHALARPRRQSGVLDILLGAVALTAVGALGYFGIGWWTSQNAPGASAAPPSTVAMTASLSETERWTEQDTARCQQKGRAAANAPIPGEMALANPAVTEGFADRATILECRIITKPARFCDPTEKAALVAAVTDYIARINVVVVALNVQGAPMSILGDMMGGEIAGGSAIYNEQRDETIAFMKLYHQRVAAGLKALGRGGVIAVGDFGGFMGLDAPPMIREILEGVDRTGNLCA